VVLQEALLNFSLLLVLQDGEQEIKGWLMRGPGLFYLISRLLAFLLLVGDKEGSNLELS